MRNPLRCWSRLLILAIPKSKDVSDKLLRKILVAQMLSALIPFTLLLAYSVLIRLFPELIHVFAVILLLIMIPMWLIGMLRMHKVGVYLRKKNDTLK